MRSTLTQEQDYLDVARSELARMRHKTQNTTVSAGNAVSDDFLAIMLARRAEALVDDPSTALFFGRIDVAAEGEAVKPWYVGRRHVSNDQGDPLVIDWRAELSGAFYRASRTEPMGVELRRRFGIDRGRLTAYEDEHLSDPAEQVRRSTILQREIERPREGPMRDIVATIQPEQDVLVRADASTSICIQGAPGTGKTAVGLHRAAWLLYAFRERLARSGVMIIGPNTAFLEHIGAVLPALGEMSVRHTTADELVASVPVRGSDPVAVAILKGDARVATVLRRALWSRIAPATEALVVPRGINTYRLPAYEVDEIVSELRERGVRYEAARRMLPQRFAHAILLRMERAGMNPDDRVQDAVARSAPVRRYAGALWPVAKPTVVLHQLLADEGALAQHAEGVLSESEQHQLLWPRPSRTAATARWSSADLVLLDELTDLIDRTPSLGHVILDEAQDLSPMHLRAVGRRASTGAVTVLGDIAQGTTPWATASWDESLAHLGKPAAHIEVLDRGFRVPSAVIDFAARLLPHMAPDLGIPVSVRDDPGRLDLRHAMPGQVIDVVLDAVRADLALPGSVGVIVPACLRDAVHDALASAGVDHGVLDAAHGDAEHRIDVVPATVAKGLEFDRVIVVEPSLIAREEPDHRTGLRRLYVVLTRAVSALTVVYAEPLPVELA